MRKKWRDVEPCTIILENYLNEPVKGEYKGRRLGKYIKIINHMRRRIYNEISKIKHINQ